MFIFGVNLPHSLLFFTRCLAVSQKLLRCTKKPGKTTQTRKKNQSLEPESDIQTIRQKISNNYHQYVKGANGKNEQCAWIDEEFR